MCSKEERRNEYVITQVCRFDEEICSYLLSAETETNEMCALNSMLEYFISSTEVSFLQTKVFDAHKMVCKIEKFC